MDVEGASKVSERGVETRLDVERPTGGCGKAEVTGESMLGKTGSVSSSWLEEGVFSPGPMTTSESDIGDGDVRSTNSQLDEFAKLML